MTNRAKTDPPENIGQFMRRFLTPKVNKAAQRILAARLAKRSQDGKFKRADESV